MDGSADGWGRVSGIHQGGANNVSQVDGDSDMATAGWVRGRLNKGTMASVSTSV